MCTPTLILWLFVATTIPKMLAKPLCNSTEIITETVFTTFSDAIVPAVTVPLTAPVLNLSLVSTPVPIFTPLPVVSPLNATTANATTTVSETVGNGNVTTTMTSFSTTRLTMTTVIPPFANTSSGNVTVASVDSTTTIVATQEITSTLVLMNLSSTATSSVTAPILPPSVVVPASVPESVTLTFMPPVQSSLAPMPTLTIPEVNSTASKTFVWTATVVEVSTATVTRTAAPTLTSVSVVPDTITDLSSANMNTTTTTTSVSTKIITLEVITSGTTTVFPTAASGSGHVNGSIATNVNITTFHASTQTPKMPTQTQPLLSVQTGAASSVRMPQAYLHVARLLMFIVRFGPVRAAIDTVTPIPISAPLTGRINVTVPTPIPVLSTSTMTPEVSIPIFSTSTIPDVNCSTTTTTTAMSNVSVPLPFPQLPTRSSTTTVTHVLTALTTTVQTIQTTMVIDNKTMTVDMPAFVPPTVPTPPFLTVNQTVETGIDTITGPMTTATDTMTTAATGTITGTDTMTTATGTTIDSGSPSTSPFNIITFLNPTTNNTETTTMTIPFPELTTGLNGVGLSSLLHPSSDASSTSSSSSTSETSSTHTVTRTATVSSATTTGTTNTGGAALPPAPPKGLVYATVTCLLLIGAGAWFVL